MNDPKYRFLTVPMPPEMYRRVGEMATAKRRSMSNLVRLLIEEAWAAEPGDSGR